MNKTKTVRVSVLNLPKAYCLWVFLFSIEIQCLNPSQSWNFHKPINLESIILEIQKGNQCKQTKIKNKKTTKTNNYHI